MSPWAGWLHERPGSVYEGKLLYNVVSREQENGRMVRWMVQVSTLGLMAGCMKVLSTERCRFSREKESSRRAREVVKESSFGLMVQFMKVTPVIQNVSREKGEFENNLRNGKGKYTWPDGTVYEGNIRPNFGLPI